MGSCMSSAMGATSTMDHKFFVAAPSSRVVEHFSTPRVWLHLIPGADPESVNEHPSPSANPDAAQQSAGPTKHGTLSFSVTDKFHFDDYHCAMDSNPNGVGSYLKFSLSYGRRDNPRAKVSVEYSFIQSRGKTGAGEGCYAQLVVLAVKGRATGKLAALLKAQPRKLEKLLQLPPPLPGLEEEGGGGITTA